MASETADPPIVINVRPSAAIPTSLGVRHRREAMGRQADDDRHQHSEDHGRGDGDVDT
jgi:hypothetical protein